MASCPEMAADAIHELRAAGLDPTLDHIATLIKLADKIQNPQARTFPYLSYVGVRAGDSAHVLKPFSIKAGLWFDFIEPKLKTETLKMYACAYAMEHGHAEGVDFTRLYSPTRAVDVLNLYARQLTCTAEELQAAIMRCMSEQTAGDRARAQRYKDEGPADIQDTIARLVATTGRGEDVWLARTFSFCVSVLNHAMQHNAGIFGGGQGAEDLEYQRDNFNFIAAVEEIQRDLKGGDAHVS